MKKYELSETELELLRDLVPPGLSDDEAKKVLNEIIEDHIDTDEEQLLKELEAVNNNPACEVDPDVDERMIRFINDYFDQKENSSN